MTKAKREQRILMLILTIIAIVVVAFVIRQRMQHEKLRQLIDGMTPDTVQAIVYREGELLQEVTDPLAIAKFAKILKSLQWDKPKAKTMYPGRRFVITVVPQQVVLMGNVRTGFLTGHIGFSADGTNTSIVAFTTTELHQWIGNHIASP